MSSSGDETIFLGVLMMGVALAMSLDTYRVSTLLGKRGQQERRGMQVELGHVSSFYSYQ